LAKKNVSRESRSALGSERSGYVRKEFEMKSCRSLVTRSLALCALFICICVSRSTASVHPVTYSVGELDSLGPGDNLFSASLLHDASAAPTPSGPVPAKSDNRAYLMGWTSGLMSGSLSGDYDDSTNRLTSIGGIVTGNLRMLLGDSVAVKNKEFVLKLGQDAGAGKTGAIQFETDGVGQGQYSGGFIDFALALAGETSNLLTGTFFFKPQAETGSLMLSPNRGDASTFTLWGYNWMHDSPAFDSDTNSFSWSEFLDPLGYQGTVTRPSIVDDADNHTLGVALYVSAPQSQLTYAANPEPTTCLVWGVLSLIGFVASYRSREIGRGVTR
jgi:hypothetical protein